jgi:hypothetical protein
MENPTEEQKEEMRREHMRLQSLISTEEDDECGIEYVYCCKWFDTRRHTISHTDMYYLFPNDVKWIFDTDEYLRKLVRIEYMPVCKKSPSYKSAFHNSYIVPTLRQNPPTNNIEVNPPVNNHTI